MLTIPIRAGQYTPKKDIEIWVDTGFTGDLVLPLSLIEELKLERNAMVRAILADGRDSRLRSYVAWIDWFGEELEIEVIAGTGESLLLGVGMLLGRRLTIDYADMSMSLM